MRRISLALAISLLPLTAWSQSRAVTADPQIDALYQLAQRELTANQVESIKDWGYRNDQPIPCRCFETGEKWHFVWTRDLAYAADLSLARIAPERVTNGLRFKASTYRDGRAGDIVAQDTGSGGSWPISSDRVVWFLAAQHLKADKGFAALRQRALLDTLKQDREFVFDPVMGLYRGETSFLDWREQNYPRWTADNVTFIGESFALSTNVLHYLALRQVGGAYASQARALKKRINAVFWDPRRGMPRSYVGPDYAPVPAESFDLLGISLAILADVFPADRARSALANYPVAEKGSPVIWPQQPDTPIYHNRAMWPFVSAYALRAARKVDDVPRIGFELDSILRGAALNGSNMENYEITTLGKHVEDGKFSGPVVNSPRQLWSVAAMLAAVEEGIFGLQVDGRIVPKIPADIGRRIFKDRGSIEWKSGERTLRLLRPKPDKSGNLWVERLRSVIGSTVTIQLQAIRATDAAPKIQGAAFAPAMPVTAPVADMTKAQEIALPDGMRLYRNGALVAEGRAYRYEPLRELQCFQATVVRDGIESLPGEAQCHANGSFRAALNQAITLPQAGHYRIVQRFSNPNGPVNTGITAAVKKLQVSCEGIANQTYPIVMPHSVREQDSTAVILKVPGKTACTFRMLDGVNMSDLKINAEYTGGKGGVAGRLNEAQYGDLLISPLAWATIPTILKD